MRVLVVEDQATIAFPLADALTRAGHEVIGPAKTSSEARELAEVHAPDIALVDLDLERKAVGLELVQGLTADLGVDVVICSGQGDLARRSQSGAVALVSKPYDPNDIVAGLSVLASGNQSASLPTSFELLVNPQ